MLEIEKELELNDFYEVLFEVKKIKLSNTLLQRVTNSHTFLSYFSKNKVIYGVNTGFVPMSQNKIEDNDRIQLQYNLIRRHAAGSGNPLPKVYVKSAMLARLNTLCLGYSGVHPSVVKLMVELINRDIIPLIYSHGGVGAS